MLFTGWEVRIGRNCARGLEYRPRLQYLQRRLKSDITSRLFCFTLAVFLADL